MENTTNNNIIPTSEYCWLKDRCPRYQQIENCECKTQNDFCIKLDKLTTLYNNALLTEKQREHTAFRVDIGNINDNIKFKELSAFEKDIVSNVKAGKNLYIHSENFGNGKAQPDESLILTPTGYTTFKDIQVGDSLFGEDGNTYFVDKKFDQGEKEIYKITFSDNTSVESCNEHLWNISSKEIDSNIYNVIELNTLINKPLKNEDGYIYQIPVTKALSFKSINIDINPYVLGCFIAGSQLVDDLKTANTFIFENTDAEEIVKVRSDKIFIPKVYLYNSFENRLKLLQGLLDTCGKVEDTIIVNIKSKYLVDDFSFLIQSLGGIVTTEFCNDMKYKCIITLPDNIIPFILKNKILDYNKLQKQSPVRFITNIEYIGKKHCFCIATSNPTHLYLTNNCTVTHNTAWSIRMIQAYLEAIWASADSECKALFINVPRFLLELKNTISDGPSKYVNHIKRNVLSADLVVWDEIATKAITTYEHEHLLSLINARIDAGKSNIYTSNMNSAELATMLGGRLYSRIVNLSQDITLTGTDKRGLINK